MRRLLYVLAAVAILATSLDSSPRSWAAPGQNLRSQFTVPTATFEPSDDEPGAGPTPTSTSAITATPAPAATATITPTAPVTPVSTATPATVLPATGAGATLLPVLVICLGLLAISGSLLISKRSQRERD